MGKPRRGSGLVDVSKNRRIVGGVRRERRERWARVGKEEVEEMGWEQWEVTEGMARLPVIWLCAGGDRRSDLEREWSGSDQNGRCIQLGGRRGTLAARARAGESAFGAGAGWARRCGRRRADERWIWNACGEESVECVGGRRRRWMTSRPNLAREETKRGGLDSGDRALLTWTASGPRAPHSPSPGVECALDITSPPPISSSYPTTRPPPPQRCPTPAPPTLVRPRPRPAPPPTVAPAPPPTSPTSVVPARSPPSASSPASTRRPSSTSTTTMTTITPTTTSRDPHIPPIRAPTPPSTPSACL